MSLLKKFFVSSKEEDNQLPPLHLAALIDDYERVKLIIEDDISAVEALDEMDKKPLSILCCIKWKHQYCKIVIG